MAPIILKNYEWSETDSSVDLVISIPGIAPGKCYDIVLTDKYIKIRYAQYMWELFLKCCIDRDVSTVQVRTGVIYCNLIKIDPMLWLEIAESMPDDDKRYVIKRREEEINKLQQIQANLKEKKDRRRQELYRAAVREQIKLEEREKERIQTEIHKEVLATLAVKPFSSPALVRDVGEATSLPPVRNCATISVTFTPYRNAVPAPESTADSQDE